MKLVVGLGNPGPRYLDTRHNVGFRIVERWAARRGIRLDEERFGGRFGRGTLATPEGPLEVAVLEPLDFMNRSGAPVAAAVAGLPIADPAAHHLVVFDDVDLPFGRLRLRAAGSAGGHRGLADVIEALGSNDLPRLRFGVGRPEGPTDTADWVLAPFSAQEQAGLEAALAEAEAALHTVLLEGVRPAMNRVNRAPASEVDEPVQ
jgi:PTH1 family peptidyl-tRNA hydrolase